MNQENDIYSEQDNNQPAPPQVPPAGGLEKRNFLLGLIAGAVIMAVIGFFIIPGLSTSQVDKQADSNSKVIAEADNQADNQPVNQAMQLKPISDDDWIKGDRNAKISIIEFSDTECPFCKRHHPTLQKIVEEYDGQVNWVYRHFPLVSIHPKAPKEAEATECAGQLAGNDGFWKYVDRLFAITPGNNGLDPAQLPQIAEYIGLDRDQFEACLDSGKYAAKVQDHYNQAAAVGARGTPFNIIVVGDQKIPVAGAVPFEQFKLILDELLGNI